MANVRQESWEEFAFPQAPAKAFQRSGGLIALATLIVFALLFWAARAIGSAGGEGFYAVLSHSAMVAIFMPAFLFPLASIAISLRRYWRSVNGTTITLSDIKAALVQAATMRNLSGGHGDGCNFEQEDKFSHARRLAHQFVMYGFLLCFASTSSGTVMHYVFDIPAPYPLWSLPKVLGISGGLLMVLGSIELLRLKFKSDRSLGAVAAWGGEVGFIALLGFVALSGHVKGPRLNGRILNLGADWQTIMGGGMAELDTRYAMETDDGAVIEIINYGYRHGPDEVIAAIARGEDVPHDSYYMRTQARLETGDPRYEWVNKTLFVGTGERKAQTVIVDLYAIE